MFGIIFKSSIAFVISFIVLSMPISNRPLFYHLSDLTGPLGGEIKKSFSKSIDRSLEKSKEIGSELFTSSNVQDRVKSKQSAILSRRRERIKKSGITSEELRHVEKKALDNLINK
jgi:hypothetical protein